MTNAAECAKAIKQELKGLWPRVKFSVKSRNSTGSSSVDVQWTYGPTSRQVEGVIEKYQDDYFYVFADPRVIPREVRMQIQQDYAALLGVEWEGENTRAHGEDISTLTRRLLDRFEMPGDGYHGLAKATDSDTNSGGELESCYVVVGGKRIDLE